MSVERGSSVPVVPSAGHTVQGDGRAPRPRVGPLAGIRVADFGWMGVGSLATRLLADFGAEVIKIESRRRLDMPRRLPIYKGEAPRSFGDEDLDPDPERGGLHNNYSRNKLGVTIDMSTERGRELAERLIASSDVVSENFAPGVMERWGLDFVRLTELRSDVIFLRMSGFGHDGPDHRYRSYGPIVQAVSGLSFISGLPGEPPSGWGFSYMDNQAAYQSSAAVLLALLHRQRTGEGCEVDVSAVEAGVGMLGPLLLEVAVNGRRTRDDRFPTGNRIEHPAAAPHGVYPCAGEDRWVAIAVFDEGEWDALRAAIGDPAWAADPRFATLASRRDDQDALDALLAAWTRQHDRHAMMELLQRHGVRAAAVQDARDLQEHDPQLAHRGVFFELDHPVIGPATFEGIPFELGSGAPDHWRSAPLLGEDNEYVFREIVGLSEREYATVTQEGVI